MAEWGEVFVVLSKPIPVFVALALATGLIIGGGDRLLSLLAPDEKASDDGEAASVSATGSANSRRDIPSHARPDDNVVVAGNGLRFTAHYDTSRFVGYLVLEAADDGRLAAGDVIVSVGGIAVEGTAAGGELLIIALMDPSAAIGKLKL